MKTWQIIHQANEGTATWTITAGYDAEPDRVFTIAPAMALNVNLSADSLSIEKDGVDATPAMPADFRSWTLYLRDTPQAFPQKAYLEPASFGVFVFLWAWLACKIAS